MYLHRVHIQGFRKLYRSEFYFSRCTFLIGENNSGKSSLLKAIGYLLSGKQSIPNEDYSSVMSEESGNCVSCVNEIVIEAEFRDVPELLKDMSGFKGRVHEITENSVSTNFLTIKKIFPLGGQATTEIKSRTRKVKEFDTYEDLAKFGINHDELVKIVGDVPRPNRKVTVKHRRLLEEIDSLIEFGDGYEWEPNPLGLMSVFSNYLPRYIEIPALHSFKELDGNKPNSAIGEILRSLFEEVRDSSKNYQAAKTHLENLSNELNPDDENSDFGKLISEVNLGFDRLFSNAKFHIGVDLSKPNDSIRPTFSTLVSSNLVTKIENQGTGLSRAAIFNLLKFRASWHQSRQDTTFRRSLFIGFEEPELYLHPSAIKQIRDFIYELAQDQHTQIICSTHSPNMIDLSKSKVEQVVNRMIVSHQEVEFEEKLQKIEVVSPFFINHTKVMSGLEQSESQHLKMLLRLDSSVVESFFSNYAAIVEGDSEVVAIGETLAYLDETKRNRIAKDIAIIRARGKPIILSLVTYLKTLGISYRVMHDADTHKSGQAAINAKIASTCGSEYVHVLQDCLEEALGYSAPTRDKPYHTFKHIHENWNSLSSIPSAWKIAFNFLFGEEIP